MRKMVLVIFNEGNPSPTRQDSMVGALVRSYAPYRFRRYSDLSRLLLCLLFLGLVAVAPRVFFSSAHAQEATAGVTQGGTAGVTQGVTAGVTEGENLTLEATIHKMLLQNGEFLAEKAGQKENNFGRISAIAGLLPTATIRGGYNFINNYKSTTPNTTAGSSGNTTDCSDGNPNPNTDGSSDRIATCSDFGYDVNVTVSQPLYSRRFYDVAERFSAHNSARHRLHASANNFILETIRAYLEVQTAIEQRKYAEKNLEDTRRLFRRVSARARVDPGQRYLLNRAQTRLSLGEEDLSKTRQLEAARRSRLARLIGQSFGSLEVVPELEGLPGSVEDSLALARESNPSLLAARSDVKRSVRASAGAWGSLIPEVNLNYNYRNARNQSGFNRTIEEHSVSIGGVYEFSSGFTRVFDALGERQRLKAARHLRMDAEHRIEEDVNNAWVEISESRRIHGQALQFLKATEREKNAYQRQFSAGQRNLLDLLNIQNEFFAAQQRELNSRVAKEVARYRMLATVGELVERFGGLSPKE